MQAAFVFEEFFAFFVIFNYVIPISLYVTLGKCATYSFMLYE